MNNKTTETMSTKIANMILDGATEEELTQAITESMEVIDSEKSKMKIRFDKNSEDFNPVQEYNEIFIYQVIGYFLYQNSDALHCLNDIYRAFGLPITRAGYRMIFEGPITMTWKKLDDHYDIEITSKPVEVFTSGRYKWEETDG